MLTIERMIKIKTKLIEMQGLESEIDGANVLKVKPLVKQYFAKNRQTLALICESLQQEKDQ
jgi:ABC-type phosphate transport system ATPase subunit